MSAVVILYSRAECHLCDVAERVLSEVLTELGLPFQKIDVDSKVDLRSRFGEDVPVVVVNGEIAFRHRVNAQALKDLLKSLSKQD